MNEKFRKFATKISKLAGMPTTFIFAMSVIAIWALTGPLFNYSNTWQLFINTTTTIVTFSMVFLIQNTQNRDSKAIHIKLDELLTSMDKARNELVEVEEATDVEMDKYSAQFHRDKLKLNKENGIKKSTNK